MAKAFKIIGKFPKSNMKEIYANLTDDEFVKKNFPINIKIKAITERPGLTFVSAINVKEWNQPSIAQLNQKNTYTIFASFFPTVSILKTIVTFSNGSNAVNNGLKLQIFTEAKFQVSGKYF